jgi:hypothetical protein
MLALKCTLFKLKFHFSSCCFLRVSNILCSPSGRPFVLYMQFLWYVFHSEITTKGYIIYLKNVKFLKHKNSKMLPGSLHCTVFNQLTANIIVYYYEFCDVPPTCLGHYTPSSGRVIYKGIYLRQILAKIRRYEVKTQCHQLKYC